MSNANKFASILTDAARAAYYCRVSTEKRQQEESLESQIARCQSVIVENHWREVAGFVEKETATDAMGRPAYRALLEAMKAGRVDIVICKSQDRLNRNDLETGRFMTIMEAMKIQLYCYMDGCFYDINETGTRLKMKITAMIDEEYSRGLSSKITEFHRRRQNDPTGKTGKNPTNITGKIFGWDRKVDAQGYVSFVVNEEEAKLYRAACSLAIDGYGYRRLAKKIEELGAGLQTVPTCAVSWRNMLKDPKYHGEVVLRKTASKFTMEGKRREKTMPEEWLHRWGLIPAIISEEYHRAVIAALDARATMAKRDCLKEDGGKAMTATTYGKHLLTKKLVCGCCGSNYQRQEILRKVVDVQGDKTREKKKVVTWVCGRIRSENKDACSNIRIEEEALIAVVEGLLCSYGGGLDEEVLLFQFLGLLRQSIRQDEARREAEAFKKRLEQNRALRRTMVRMWVTGEIEKSDFEEFDLPNKKEREVLEKQLKECELGAARVEERMVLIRQRVEKGQLCLRASAEAMLQRVEKVVVNPSAGGDVQIHISMEEAKQFLPELSQMGRDKNKVVISRTI